MKISARNCLGGKIKSIEFGAVNAEIVIELPGGQEIVSIITKHSAEEMGLKKGQKALAVIKASSVLVMTE